MFKRILIVVTIAVVFLLSLSDKAFAKHIELLDADNNYQKAKSFPYDRNYEIVVASDDASEDIRRYLPITITIQVGDKKLTNIIPNTPQSVCRGADRCSIPGPVIKSEARGLTLTIRGIGNNGDSMGEYREIIYSSKNKSAPSKTVSPTKSPISPSDTPNERSPTLLSSSGNNSVKTTLAVIGLLAVGLAGLGVAAKAKGFWIIPKNNPGNKPEIKEEDRAEDEHDNCTLIREKKNVLVRKINELQEKINTFRIKINTISDQIQAKRKQQDTIDKQTEALSKKIVADKLMENNYKSELERARLRGDTEQVKNLEEKISNFDSKTKEDEAKLDSLQKEKNNLEDQIQKLAGEAISLSGTIANLEEQQITILNEIIVLAREYKKCITAECQPGQMKLGDEEIPPHEFTIPDGERPAKITTKGLVGGGTMSPEEAENLGKTAEFINWLGKLAAKATPGIGQLPVSVLFSYISAGGKIMDAMANFARKRESQDVITITAEIPVKIYSWNCKQKYSCMGGSWNKFGEGHRRMKEDSVKIDTITISGTGQGREAALYDFISRMTHRKDQFDKETDEWKSLQTFCKFD